MGTNLLDQLIELAKDIAKVCPEEEMKVHECRVGDLIYMQTGSQTGKFCRVISITEAPLVRVRLLDGSDRLVSKNNDCVLTIRKMTMPNGPINTDQPEMWEILVPTHFCSGKFDIKHHQKWDAKVASIGGLTILKAVKGKWISPNRKDQIVKEKMIPVRIVCTEQQIVEIIEFTKEHYTQEAVLAYKVSSKVLIQ